IVTEAIYSITRWDKQQLDEVIIEDANADGATWALFEEASGMSYMRYRYSSLNEADDYIYLHPVALQAGKNYEAQLYLRAGSSSYEEYFSVGITSDIDTGSVQSLLTSQCVDSKESTPYTVRFAVDSDNLYRLYVHCSSPANHYMLYLDSLVLNVCGEGIVPNEVQNFSLTCHERTPNVVTVACEAPTCHVDGSPLDSLDALVIYRNDVPVYSVERPLPGQEVSYNDTLDVIGDYTYKVLAINENGEGVAVQEHLVAGVAPFPYAHSFVDGIGYFSIDDYNADGVAWHFFDGRFGGCMRYMSSATNDANDWLFTPPIYLAGSMRYQVEYSCCVGLSNYPESMSVLLGFVPRVQEMSMVVSRLTDFAFVNDTTIIAPFEVQVPGVYYMAFRADSKADSYAILLRSVAISEYDTNSLAVVEGGATVVGRKGCIELVTNHAQEVHVYNLLGVEVAFLMAQGRVQHSLSSGVYLVQIGGATHKVLVQ
ncbi:MAG: T9SS type A sorting domain-containing protein, partial [Bacteroidales bacterium]|nr:T9SS type A sorting domain-containing protein [Bacteroidales bacterium]